MLLVRARRWLSSLWCRLAGHDWTITTVTNAGAAVAIRHCARCPKIDGDSIAVTAWNRRMRRAARRA